MLSPMPLLPRLWPAVSENQSKTFYSVAFVSQYRSDTLHIQELYAEMHYKKCFFFFLKQVRLMKELLCN